HRLLVTIDGLAVGSLHARETLIGIERGVVSFERVFLHIEILRALLSASSGAGNHGRHERLLFLVAECPGRLLLRYRLIPVPPLLNLAIALVCDCRVRLRAYS